MTGGRLHSYDHLAYSEIHRRVQNDIKNNLQNHISGLELKLDYTDVSDDKFRSNKAGTYGRADIYYANELTRVMYLWEVKPSSYRDTNKSKGLKQIDRYVNNGYSELYSNFDFDYGSNSPGSINNRQFQFHLSLDCAEGTESWIEDVTYTVNYETIEFGLIIYDFIRSSTKTKKQKDEKTNSEAESGSNENTGDNTSSQDSESSNDKSKKNGDSVIPLLFPWWLLPGGGNSNTGSGDNISNNDSKPSITQIQGGKQNNRKIAIATGVLAVAVAGAALALPYLTSHQMSSLKGFIPPLSGVEYSALFIRNNGTLVHAKEGDFYVLPDIGRNHALVFNNKAANHTGLPLFCYLVFVLNWCFNQVTRTIIGS